MPKTARDAEPYFASAIDLVGSAAEGVIEHGQGSERIKHAME
ncbi:hypothetical protein [Thiocystis violascens]|nr:hypothetical protein [Thiocystis violascens]